MWFVYILLCEDNSLYTGISINVEQRFLDHKSGKGASYTKSRKPIKIIYQEQLENHSQASKREIEIKSWKRQDKIRFLKLDLSL